MATQPPTGLVNSIIDRIEAAYVSKGWRLFFPQQFTSLAPLESVLAALSALRSTEQLHAIAVIECVNGHQVWAGEPEQALDHIHDACPSCADEALEDPILRFEMAAPWRQRLDGHAEKKRA